MTPEEMLRAAAAPGSVDLPPAEAPRHVSPWRLLGLLTAVAAVLVALVGYVDVRGTTAVTDPVTDSTFSAYVDVTATPLYPFENPQSARPTDAVLGFVVSAPDSACAPSWGAAYSLDEAADALDLDRRVARLQQLGGDVAVSFGGAANSELAIGCTDPEALTAAYRSVIERYSSTTIDLDIEGAESSAPDVVARRSASIAALQDGEERAGRSVDVWLTLPVGPGGLTSEGSAVLAAALAAHVRLAGVNAMVMDYGEPMPVGSGMADLAQLSLTALQEQLRSAFDAIGTPLSAFDAWQLVGATPMIGQNDTADEIFGLADARQLVAFARDVDVRRISMWSANRDQGCGPNYPDLRVVSDECSGVTQDVGGFAAVLRRFIQSGVLDIGPTDRPTSPSTATEVAPPSSSATDDPATSPYAIWNDHQAYEEGTKIVWLRNVYQAKWYSVGSRPDTPVSDVWQTPWTLLGPVMPGEHPVSLPTVSAGTYPRWDAGSAYVAGSRVVRNHVGYQAKWWTRGDVPGAILDSPYDSPWRLIDAD